MNLSTSYLTKCECPHATEDRHSPHSGKFRHVVVQHHDGAIVDVFPACTAHANEYRDNEAFVVLTISPESAPRPANVMAPWPTPRHLTTQNAHWKYQSRGQRIAEHFGKTYEEWYA